MHRPEIFDWPRFQTTFQHLKFVRRAPINKLFIVVSAAAGITVAAAAAAAAASSSSSRSSRSSSSSRREQRSLAAAAGRLATRLFSFCGFLSINYVRALITEETQKYDNLT
jgi:hypothetical protein